MNILQIYKKYQIMPQLAEHQLTVAAVAEELLNHLSFPPKADPPPAEILDRHDVVAACLLHDMGNIVKFDLTKTPDLHPGLFLKPKDRIFWESVKQEFIERRSSNSSDKHSDRNANELQYGDCILIDEILRHETF